MASNHSARYVAAGKESTYNSPVAYSAYGEVESESFQQSYDVLKRNDMNYYGAAKAIVSKKIAEGSISMALQPDKFTLMMLHGIMGQDAPSSDGGSSPTTDERTFTEHSISSNVDLPSYTFRVGRDNHEHIFAGQVIESISVSASIGEYAMMTVNTVGASQNSSTAALNSGHPTYTKDAAHFSKIFVDFEGTASNSDHSLLVQSVDFEVKTNRDMDNSYSLGDETCVRAPPRTLREISGSLTFHKSVLSTDTSSNNEPHFDELMGATSANGQALFHPAATTPALSVLFEVDGDNFIRFDFAKIHFEMPETSVSGRDTQTMTVNFHALYDLDNSLGNSKEMMRIVCKSEDGLADYDA
mgnify:CR=1 FL=1|tara:strand:- start:7778 stop:8845 length:1068 start_codon:yes stop_codon:yes gene_type:complete